LAVALSAAPALAGPGDLDPSFGVGGRVVAPFGYAARDVLLLPDGKILVAGGHLCPGGGCGFTLARFHAGGEPDDAFGSKGGVLTPMLGVVGISAVVRQSDGKLVAAGDASGQDQWVLARYNEHGMLDSGFGSGGVTVTERAVNASFAGDVIVTAGGKLVAAGMLDGNFAIARYNADGSLDGSFGDGGKVVTAVGSSSSSAHAVIELPDGKLLAAGGAMGPGLFGDTSHDALLRYNADGSLDESFGSHGKVIGLAGYANALVRQPDGKLVTAGSRVARYNAEGSVDVGFAPEPTPPWIVHDVLLQPDGKLVVVGVWRTIRSTSWVVRRFEPNGAPDASFCVPPIFPRGEAYAAALQSDGKLLVSGESPVFGAGYMLARYLGDGSGPCADLIAPVAKLRIPRQRLGRVLTRGFAVTVGSSEPGKATLRLILTPSEARRVGITRRTTVGRGSHSFARGGRTKVRIHLTRAAKKRLGQALRVTVSVRLAVADRSANTVRLARRLTLRR